MIKDIFFNLIDEKALEFMSKKIAKMNGDVRVAFDLMKTCYNKLSFQVKHEMDELDE